MVCPIMACFRRRFREHFRHEYSAAIGCVELERRRANGSMSVASSDEGRASIVTEQSLARSC